MKLRLVLLLMVGMAGPAYAHEVRPAYLQLAEQADGTFVHGPLTCYEDLFEDSIGDFADETVGADTPEDAVDRWWSQGDGQFRDDRNAFTESISGTQVLYDDAQGNAQLVLGLRELPAGGWVVETTMACVYL